MSGYNPGRMYRTKAQKEIEQNTNSGSLRGVDFPLFHKL